MVTHASRGEAHDPLKPLDWHHKPPSPGNYGAWRPSGLPRSASQARPSLPRVPEPRRHRWSRRANLLR